MVCLYLNGLDHLIILCHRGQGTELLARLDRYLSAKGLSLNHKKTRKVDFAEEGLSFLGFQLYWQAKEHP